MDDITRAERDEIYRAGVATAKLDWPLAKMEADKANRRLSALRGIIAHGSALLGIDMEDEYSYSAAMRERGAIAAHTPIRVHHDNRRRP